MDAKIIEKLRRNQLVRRMLDGGEGVEVTLQFLGAAPKAPRAKRKQWLEQRCSQVQDLVGPKLEVKPGSISVSGQTVAATASLDDIDTLREQLEQEEVRLDIMVPMQVV